MQARCCRSLPYKWLATRLSFIWRGSRKPARNSHKRFLPEIPGKTLLFAAFLAGVVPAAWGDGAKRRIQENMLSVVDTGLEPLSCCSRFAHAVRLAYWLNNELLAINALQTVPDANRQRLQRTMLLNIRTGEMKPLFEREQLVCWNDETGAASLELIEGKSRTRRIIHLSRLGEVEEYKDSENIDPSICVAKSSIAQKGNSAQLKESDGYIYLSDKDGKYSQYAKAVWHKPGHDPIELPIYAKEVTENIPIFLAFSNQYLLNRFDSQGASATDRRLAGVTWRDRPYDLTPYRLLSRNGEVEEIPYPKILFEYGISWFGKFLPTKAGYLISKTGKGEGEYGLFLLRDDQLFRIWGGSHWRANGTNELIVSSGLSPDGCRLVFSHAKDWEIDTRKKISIINLCEGT